MKYRVIIKISYTVAIFEFDDLTTAGNFANVAAKHAIANEDKIAPSVTLKFVREEEEKEETE